MKIGIMQPYFFPFLGYFQLVSAVDTFIFYDDVNFIKQGWINRNRLLVNGMDWLFTIPCTNVSSNKFIFEINVNWENRGISKFLKTIEQNYKKAPYFDSVLQLIKDVLEPQHKKISQLAEDSIKKVSYYLNLSTFFKTSSNADYRNRSMKKADRLIDICNKENVTTYINPHGGKILYDKLFFENKGIKLYFLNPKPIIYKQFNAPFVPGLSIIDTLMFNSPERIEHNMLNQYTLT